MSNISRRINAIEKRLSVGQHEEPRFIHIIVCPGPEDKVTAEERDKLGLIRVILSKKVCDEMDMNESDIQPRICKESN